MSAKAISGEEARPPISVIIPVICRGKCRRLKMSPLCQLTNYTDDTAREIFAGVRSKGSIDELLAVVGHTTLFAKSCTNWPAVPSTITFAPERPMREFVAARGLACVDRSMLLVDPTLYHVLGLERNERVRVLRAVS